MGIDARILVRYRGPQLTDDDLTRKSWDLCSAIGASHFFISDGLPPAEYHVASDAWHAAFNAHPQYPKWRNAEAFDSREDRQAARAAILADIGEAPKERRRAIDLTRALYPDELAEYDDIPGSHCAPGQVYTQDGPSLLAKDGETFLEVSLWSRWCGVGCERGDLLTICAVAEWLEVNLAPCEVWYGGDSSGVLAERFDEAKRLELRRHLYGASGKGYFKHEERGTFPTPKPCSLCVPGEDRFDRFGWGPNYVAVGCAGCGKKFASHDGGKTWAEEKESR